MAGIAVGEHFVVTEMGAGKLVVARSSRCWCSFSVVADGLDVDGGAVGGAGEQPGGRGRRHDGHDRQRGVCVR